MRFTHFAPAVLLGVALVLLKFPWFSEYSGFDKCGLIAEQRHRTPDPLLFSLLVLLILYPVALLLGTIFALIASPSSGWAVVVGGLAFFGLATLTALYLLLLCMDPGSIKKLTVSFYLSHAANLACVILCVRECKRPS